MLKTPKNSVLIALLSASSLVYLAGCNSESVDSEDVNISGIWAKMDVDARSDGQSRVVVELNVGGELGTNVVLSNGEYLEVVAAGTSTRMLEDEDFLDIDYQAYINTTESDTEFNIRFYRNNGDNIVESLATIPTAFEITGPSDDSLYGLDNNVDLVWTPERAGESIRLFSRISCTNADGGTQVSSDSIYIADAGTYSFDISTAAIFSNGTTGLNTAQPCQMNFTLQREAFGVVDPLFDESSRFKTTQSREIDNLVLNLD